MKDIYKIAFRNLWRNKRRTLITIASIFFAVFFAIIMRSLQIGTYGNMIKTSVESYSGYLQIQNPDYFNEPIIDNSIEFSDKQLNELNLNSDIKIAVPRIETFSLASYGTQTKGVMISGIDPILEKGISNPSKNLVKYSINKNVISIIIEENILDDKQIKLLESKENLMYKSINDFKYAIALKEDQLSKIENILEQNATIDNHYLDNNDQGVLISSQLAKYLNISIGDTLVLMGQGYYGSNAAGLFPIKGIVKLANPELDNKLIYMTIQRAQEYLDMYGMYSYIAINLNKPKKMFQIQDDLQNNLDNDFFSVKNWEEYNITLKQQISSDENSGVAFLYILYFIIFFGIFGTVMMMISERKREFGVMIAIGMTKNKIKRVIRVEMMIIGILATLISILASSPFIYYFHHYPIRLKGEIASMLESYGFDATMPFANFDTYIIWQALTVFIMIVVACIIPLRKIKKLKLIESLKD